MKYTFIILSFIFMSVGCQSPAFERKEKTIVRLTTIESTLDPEILQVYKILHPEVEIMLDNISLDPKEDLDVQLKRITKNTEVVLTNSYLFKLLSEKGMLQSLDSRLKKEFDWSIHEPMLQKAVIEAGDGEQVFGLSPHINSSAILCNVDLFKKAGVPIPEKRLSWDEFQQLGRKLVQNLNQPALSIDSFYYHHTITNYLMFQKDYQNAQLLDRKTRKLQLNSPTWKSIWEKSLKEMKTSRLLDSNEFSNTYEDCYAQKVPMAIINTGMFAQLKVTKPNLPIRMIPLPIHPIDPKVNPALSFKSFYAISKDSTNSEEAWKFINFIMSEDVANHFDVPYEWSTVIKVNDRKPEKSAFIHGEYSSYCNMKDFLESYVGWKFSSDFSDLTHRLFDQVGKGKKSLEETLVTWQEESQKILDKVIEEGKE